MEIGFCADVPGIVVELEICLAEVSVDRSDAHKEFEIAAHSDLGGDVAAVAERNLAIAYSVCAES